MSEKQTVIIAHHDDMDGYVAAKILADEFNNEEKVDKIEFIECSYHKDMHSVYEPIIYSVKKYKNPILCVVDFNISEELLDLIPNQIGFDNFIWIDHHTSNVSYWECHSNMVHQMKGLRINYGLSATELAYLYVDHAFRVGYNRIAYLNKEYQTDNRQELDALLNKLPLGIRTVGSYDVWREWREEYDNGLYLNKYFYANHPKFGPAYDELWDPFIAFEHDAAYDVAMEDGKAILSYDKARYADMVTKTAFEATILDFTTMKAIAMNTQEKSSLVFDSVKDQYEVGITFNTDGTETRYSFYRLGLNPTNNIDCSLIANTFGGGGHRDAAGCTLENEYRIITKKQEEKKTYSPIHTVTRTFDLLTLKDIRPGSFVAVLDATADDRVQSELGVIYVRTAGDYSNLIEGWEPVYSLIGENTVVPSEEN